jgi:hypothetical protein
MIHRIVQARALPEYRLFVRFSDGLQGEVSLAHLVGRGVFSAWNDPAEFEAVSIDSESGTVVWPGGADLAPDELHKRISEPAVSR